MKPTPAILLLSSLFLSLSSTISAAEILPGATLSALKPTQFWSSPDNTFALRFITDKTTRFVAITYNDITIWKAGGATSNGGAADPTASLQFLQDGNLRLVNGSTGSVVWQSGTAGRGVSSASLENSGNFILKNGTVSVWSSFDNPSDSILPSQNFTLNSTLRSGLYDFRLLINGTLTLRWNSTIVYWNSGLNSSVATNLTSPSIGLQPTGTLSLYDSTILPVDMVYSSDYGTSDLFRFVKLDSDGNLRIYSSTRGSGTQYVRWAAVSDQCQVFGYCGDLGVCSYNNLNPVCGCPSRNFDLVDPKDSRKGCKRKEELDNCVGSETMLQLNNTKFLTYPPELSSQIFSAGLSGCMGNCLASGACIASTLLADGTGTCYQKMPGFVSGYQSPALPSSSFVKVCPPVLNNPPASSGKGWKLHAWIVAVVVIATILGLVTVESGLWCWCFRNSPKLGAMSSQYALLEYASGAPVQFSYKELQRATKGFKEQLGAGGFGAVYKGILANRSVAAVKQLEGIEQGEKQFRMEVATISSTHHLNLVRLIGFCSEGRHRLLVYEFMKNGSLENFVFKREDQSGKSLNWENRFHIALGTARGITYLHEECRDCIVHCDIKPENILLDENFNAKVSDFGLAKLVNPKDHRYRTLTSVRGTRGYLAPEWLANLPMTSKSDVYSYGMVLLEIVSGRRNYEVSRETNSKMFSLWAYEEFEKSNIGAIVDKRLSSHEVDMEQVMRAIQVSFWCIQEQPSLRPMMGKVVQMLEGIIAIEKPPAPKAATEGPLSRAIANLSSSGSSLSTSAASEPARSLSSSFQTAGISSFASGRGRR
ncbi:hypothetical protein RJ640_014117 [Escallonia rubra]|uniref:Receptor-like serine/threonine-protein kinase n=1 Tax=Escallonia rubra TaxID=112253 RepID=A0AA88TZJ1_9ASTE|nr:hypothetical protein RJ640_014117 [Escallonia rubra]